jgi:hypothetical protein
MRAGIIVNVTQADRHRLEAIVSDRSASQHVWRATSFWPLPKAAVPPRSLFGQIEACGVEMAGAVHGGGCRRVVTAARVRHQLVAQNDSNKAQQFESVASSSDVTGSLDSPALGGCRVQGTPGWEQAPLHREFC